MRAAIAILLVAACGRIDFAPLDDGGNANANDVLGGGGDSAIPGAMTVQLASAGGCSAMAWSGGVIGVLWEGLVGGSLYDFTFAAYDVNGQLTQGPLKIGGTNSGGGCPAIEWTGSQFLVAVIQPGSAGLGDIFVGTVTMAGASALTNVSNDSKASNDPAFALRSGQVVLTWMNSGMNDDVYARPLSPLGVPTAAGYLASTLTGVNTSPRVAATPTGFALVWLGDAMPRVLALDATGAIAGTETAIAGTAVADIGVTSTGTDLLDVWPENGASTARFDATGAVTAGPFAYPAAGFDAPVLAWSGSDGRLLYTGDDGVASVRLARIASTGQILDDVQLGDAQQFQFRGALRWLDDRYAAAYKTPAGEWLTILPP